MTNTQSANVYRARSLVALALCGVAACTAPAGSQSATGTAAQTPVATELDPSIARPPYDRFYVDFKETLDEQFVYIEVSVPANDLRSGVQRLLDALQRRSVEPAGPIFVEHIGDPRPVAASNRTSETTPWDQNTTVRIAVPVDAPVDGDTELRYAIAAPRTVVYTRISGPFGSSRSAFPALDEHMSQWGWIQHGPVREIYQPSATEPGGFITEVQIPWAPGR